MYLLQLLYLLVYSSLKKYHCYCFCGYEGLWPKLRRCTSVYCPLNLCTWTNMYLVNIYVINYPLNLWVISTHDYEFWKSYSEILSLKGLTLLLKFKLCLWQWSSLHRSWVHKDVHKEHLLSVDLCVGKFQQNLSGEWSFRWCGDIDRKYWNVQESGHCSENRRQSMLHLNHWSKIQKSWIPVSAQ